MTTKQRILQAAIDLTAIAPGITQEQVARAASVSKGLVTHYFASMDNLRDEVMRAAVDQRLLAIVAAGLAARSPIALAAPPEVRSAAVATLGGDL